MNLQTILPSVIRHFLHYDILPTDAVLAYFDTNVRQCAEYLMELKKGAVDPDFPVFPEFSLEPAPKA